VPSEVAREHVKQAPSQALSQHTPSTQNPLLHWTSHEQASPLSLFRAPSSVQVFEASAASVLPPSPTGVSMPASLGFGDDLLQALAASRAAASMTIRHEP